MKEETKENNFKFHDSIISWACIIWAVASVALMCYFTGMNQVTFSIMTFGQLFIVMGIISFVKRQAIMGGVFTVTGIGSIIIPAINQWGGMFGYGAETDNIFPILLSTAITLIGLSMLVVPGILENMAERRCTLKVKGECVDIKTVTYSNGKVYYAPVYSYTVDEKLYTKCTERYKSDNVPTVGSRFEFKVNPKKPEDVYFEASKASLMLIYIFGMSFFIAGVGMVITVLSNI